MMEPATIPAAVAVRAVAGVLAERLHALERVADRPDAARQKRAGRQAMLASLRGQLHELGALLQGRRLRQARALDAADVGLLVAWATGWTQATGILEERHPRFVDVASEDLAGGVRLLCGL